MNKAAATSPLTPPADVVVAGPARAAWLWARVSLALWRHGNKLRQKTALETKSLLGLKSNIFSFVFILKFILFNATRK